MKENLKEWLRIISPYGWLVTISLVSVVVIFCGIVFY